MSLGKIKHHFYLLISYSVNFKQYIVISSLLLMDVTMPISGFWAIYIFFSRVLFSICREILWSRRCETYFLCQSCAVLPSSPLLTCALTELPGQWGCPHLLCFPGSHCSTFLRGSPNGKLGESLEQVREEKRVTLISGFSQQHVSKSTSLSLCYQGTTLSSLSSLSPSTHATGSLVLILNVVL